MAQVPYRDRFNGERSTGAVIDPRCCRATCPTCSRPACSIASMMPIQAAHSARGSHRGAVPLGRQLGRSRAASARQRDRVRAGRLEDRNGSNCTPTRISPRCISPKRSRRRWLLRPFSQGRRTVRPGAAVPAQIRDPRGFAAARSANAARSHPMGEPRAERGDSTLGGIAARPHKHATTRLSTA